MRIAASSMLTIAMLAASPAMATPPQVVSVKETLIAMGGGLLFIKRELNDNMGSHHLQQTDTVLIARDIETNSDTYIWPLERTLDNGPDHVVTDTSPRVAQVPLDEQNLARQIIYRHHGRHANLRKATPENAVEVLSNADGMLISASTPTFAYETPTDTAARTSYWMSYAELSDQFVASLRNTRYSFPPHFVEGGDTLINPEFEPALDCTFNYFAQLSEQTDGEQQAIWATYVTCENDNTMAPVSMFVTLRKLP